MGGLKTWDIGQYGLVGVSDICFTAMSRFPSAINREPQWPKTLRHRDIPDDDNDSRETNVHAPAIKSIAKYTLQLPLSGWPLTGI